MIISVHPSVPVKSVKELIAFVRAQSGQLSFAIPAFGGPQRASS